MKSLSKSNKVILALVAIFIFAGIFGSDDEPTNTPSAPSVTFSPDPVAEEPVASQEIEASPKPTASETKAPETQTENTTPAEQPESEVSTVDLSAAIAALNELPIKGRAPKTGYSREMFADGWENSLGCDTRNKILRRDFVQYSFRSGSSCIIELGVLEDPYTGQTINFQRGVGTSLEVQIDHVVSLSDAWQKGAQQLSAGERKSFYNDPLNLLAVSGSANSQKSDSDAASWLPSNKAFRCDFVARQLAVKLKYRLWATQAEHDTFARILGDCPNQQLPSS